MKNNLFLEVEYLGSNYFGFQIQNKKGLNEITVQSVIEEALGKLFKQEVRIIYSSRTDRGVHAKAQALNFHVDTAITLSNIKRALNNFLPPDVRVITIKRVSPEFHARFWAHSKIYRYVIASGKNYSVFEYDRCWHIAEKLDIDKMAKAAKKFIGRRDYSPFARKASVYKDCLRMIWDIKIAKKGRFIHIDIEASGFLRNMARNIVACLVRVGRGSIPLRDMALILGKKKTYINHPAPACGLYLCKVKYNDF